MERRRKEEGGGFFKRPTSYREGGGPRAGHRFSFLLFSISRSGGIVRKYVFAGRTLRLDLGYAPGPTHSFFPLHMRRFKKVKPEAFLPSCDPLTSQLSIWMSWRSRSLRPSLPLCLLLGLLGPPPLLLLLTPARWRMTSRGHGIKKISSPLPRI